MNNKPIVIGLGEILWDMLPTGKVLGGAPANFACHVSQLGCSGYAISATGKDVLGREIIDTLNQKKLNYLIEQIDFPTGTVQVTLDDNGIPQYEICENVAWDNIPFFATVEELAKNCSAICFGSLAQRSETSRTTIRKILSLVPATSFKIFDINLRQHFYNKEIIHQSLLNSNILKINDDEVKVIAEMYGLQALTEQEICEHLLKTYRLKAVIETKGATGSYVTDGSETSYLETPKVQVADTVGAGDSFTSAFISAILHNKTLSHAHKLAVEVSAYVCTQHGAMPELPNAYTEMF
jgi:fructokinase